MDSQGRLAAVLLVTAAVLVSLSFALKADARPGAQLPAGSNNDQVADPDGVLQNVFPAADRSLLLLLTKARQLIEQERFAEAVQCLGTILESPEDAFFRPSQKSELPSGLKAEAQAMLGRLPRQGRELYELQYGAGARRLLSAAAASGDAAGLAEVSRRFFHTAAGYEATLLLGLHYWNHGSPLAAALTLKRLRDQSPVAAIPGPHSSRIGSGLKLVTLIGSRHASACGPSAVSVAPGPEFSIATKAKPWCVVFHAASWFAGETCPFSSCSRWRSHHHC